MLVSNLLFTVALGTTAVSARAVERSGFSSSPAQQPLDPSLKQPPSHLPTQDSSSSQTCKFSPSLPLPTTFTSTLPSTLYSHLPSLLYSHFISPSSLSSPTAPLITTLSLAEETGDASLQGIYLGLVYTSFAFTLHSPPPAALPPTASLSLSPPDAPPQKPKNKNQQGDFDKTWGTIGLGMEMERNEKHPLSPSTAKLTAKQKMQKAREEAKLQCKKRKQEKRMKKCFHEAVDKIGESRLVEGTLEYPGEGGKMRFLIWRVD
ncbi:hypothetical protein ACMFMG_009205 [Clarireedia jacksonii]